MKVWNDGIYMAQKVERQEHHPTAYHRSTLPSGQYQ